MTIYYDPAKIFLETLKEDENGNLKITKTDKTLADHYRECKGCPFCD